MCPAFLLKNGCGFMGWRLSRSLEILRNEINAKHPNRDKRADGAISGYPGSISSHNVNSLGVVNAIDVTVGSYVGGITHAQALEDVEQIRQSIKRDPRGYDAYVIYQQRIADGCTGEWRTYYGEFHGSHYHVSSAHDIPMGGVTAGNNDYDIELPWLNRGGEDDMATPKENAEAIMAHRVTVGSETARVIDWLVFLVNAAKAKK